MKYILWKHNKKLIAGTTLRSSEDKEFGNVALHTPGNQKSIMQNRRQLAADCDSRLEQWVFPCQTHSDHIKEVTLQDRGKGVYRIEDSIPDCDALYTKAIGVALGVFHADCVPVLLYDPLQGIICAIHAGWKSTVQEITSKACKLLIEKEGCHPESMEAYIGPAISYKSFEVGSEVVKLVQSMSFDTSDYITTLSSKKALVDVKGLNEHMLLCAGLSPEFITIDKNDTFVENEALFSYRRDHSCGRHVSFILRRS